MRRSPGDTVAKAGLLASGLLTLAAGVMLIAPAFACTALGIIEMHPTSPPPGGAARIEGSQFSPGPDAVRIYWGAGDDNGGTLLASVVPSADGTFDVTVPIPANAEPGRSYQMTAFQDVNSRQPVSVQVDIASPGAATAPAPSLVDRPGAPAPVPGAAVVPEVNAAEAAAAGVAPAPPAAALGDVPAVAGASPFGVAPFRAGQTSPVAPLDNHAQSHAFGPAHSLGGGLSPWMVVPLAGLGIGLLAGSAGYAVQQARRQRAVVHA